MSDFKFSCPICNQHIAYDASHLGMEIACPNCHGKVVVPREPSQAPIAPAPHLPAVTATGAKTSGLAIASLICSLSSILTCVGWIPGIICGHMAKSRIRRDPSLKGNGMATAGLVISYATLVLIVGSTAYGLLFWSSAFHQAYQQARQAMATNNIAGKPAQPAASADENQNATNKAGPQPASHETQPVNSSDVEWMSDVKDASIPDDPVNGKIHGMTFEGQKVLFRSGTLRITSGTGETVNIQGLASSPTALENQNYEFELAGSDAAMPHGTAPLIKITWNEGGHAKNETFKTGYAMKLKFEAAKKRKIRAQIYVCLPDDSKSWIAGTFTVTVTKPKQ